MVKLFFLCCVFSVVSNFRNIFLDLSLIVKLTLVCKIVVIYIL